MGPRPPSLAPAPTGDWWDAKQWTVLLSLVDAVLSPVVAADSPAGSSDRHRVRCLPRADFDATVARVRAAVVDPPDAALVAAYLADRPSDNPVFVEGVKRSLARQTPASRKLLGNVLTLLS